QVDIARHVGTASDTDVKTKLITLDNLDATKVVLTLQAMFGEAKAGAPYIEAQGDTNSLIVRGTADQLKEVELTLKAVGETGFQGAGMRLISLDKASAATLASELKRLLSEMRQNPVRVITPGVNPTPKPPEAPKKPDLEEQENAPPDDDPPAQVKSQLVDPQEKKTPAGEKPGNKNAPITIMPSGNKLLISSDDPEALKLVQELVRLMTQPPSVEGGDFEVIKLKNANATDAARILDEMFNGTPQRGGFGGFGGFGGRGFGG